ncbi:Acg family FMN-binding oxidoreductase [Streptomyces sp. SCSIO ZS0520]|uniref:Acg family FMN-binding oxidoreductase n=1 Tax=Streptomyces sp. SCSIO ZS0520 TaxID=2892996 RepID=UPI0021DB4D8F|nr:nitroreductase [Streptomyces sp. SCSIO ZS0520]
MTAPTLDKAAVTRLVAEAAQAPSMHNAQPWSFAYTPSTRTFRLHADLSRAMLHADPSTRGLHLGCGAALLNLRVAAAHAGWRTETTLLPEPGSPTCLAAVRLTGHDRAVDDLTVLYPAIADRHTSRSPYSDRRLPADVRRALVEGARKEGAALAFPEEPHLRFVADLVRDAESYHRMDAGLEIETRSWTHRGPTAPAADGVPTEAFGPRWRSGTTALRDFAGRVPVPGRETAAFEERPQLALLTTEHDSPADWLRAGQALEHVLLLATAHGVAASFATQPLEWPDLRWAVRDPLTTAGAVQMILRLGYGPEGSRTPRRPVEQILTIDDCIDD